MQKVYFKEVDSYENTDEINEASRLLLEEIIKKEDIHLKNYIPLKVTFGEKGNKTFIEPKNFESIISYLSENEIKSSFMETNVLYRGERTTKDNHTNLAKEHGFTSLPIVIADGEYGDEYENVVIHKKHYKSCKIASKMADANQMIVISHFKGHMLAGFGGAIKQLAMGCASRGGKLEQHANSIPKISSLKCKVCNACVKKCPEEAIVINKKAKIDKNKCVGCAACMAICPHNAISNGWIASLSNSFSERLTEYAYAAHNGKNNIYISFAFNITRGCDCEGHKMKPIVPDIGIFASTDPVAIDMACLDMLDKMNNKTVFRRGRKALTYGEEIGLGTKNYELIKL